MRLRLLPILMLTASVAFAQQHSQPPPYSWKSVQIVGGGFVDGVIFHPTAPGIRYARTDMGGAYRWSYVTNRWEPVLDWMPYKDLNLMGVESIAVDPSDPNRLYLACGTYTNSRTPNGAILRSNDRGKTFQRTDVPFKFGGNEDGRGNGERLAVDPRNGRILYLGTRHDGLWRSQDRGVTWSNVTTFPDVTEAETAIPTPVPGETPDQRWRRMPIRGSGIVFVHFDKSDSEGPATETIYVGVSLINRSNLFVSHDAGATWQPITYEPTQYRPTRAALSSDGFLYVTYGTAPGPTHMSNGAVWKLNTNTGSWIDITPDHPAAGAKEFGYAAVSVDAQNPGTLIVSSFGRPGSAGGEDIFRSTDAGATWKPIFGSGGVYDYALAPYVKPTPIHWLFDIEIDPTDSNHAVFTTGYGGWETIDLTASDRGQPTHWSALASGIEETVALELESPTQGAHLLTAVGDYGSFVHWDLDHPAPEGASSPPRLSNTTGIACAALRPEVIVRVGVNAEHKSSENIGYSLDSGRTWKTTLSSPTPQSRSGSIAVSADGSTWVWTPEREAAYVTRDMGATWKAANRLPSGLRVIADPIEPRWFYAFWLTGHTLYRSVDGAATFTAQSMELPDKATLPSPQGRGDNRGGQDRIYAAPGRSRDLWLAAWDGLYHAIPSVPRSENGDVAVAREPGTASFSHLPDVSEIHAFGFGKAAPGMAYPALYLVGTVKGQPGIFRSTDEAQTWFRINDDKHQWGLVLQISGDPRVFGRVYVGTHGRGVFYGDPAKH